MDTKAPTPEEVKEHHARMLRDNKPVHYRMLDRVTTILSKAVLIKEKRLNEKIETLEGRLKSMETALGSLLSVVAEVAGETAGVPLPDGCVYLGLSDPGKTYYENQVVFVRGEGFRVLVRMADDSYQWASYTGPVSERSQHGRN